VGRCTRLGFVRQRFRSELAEWIAIESVSADPNRAGDVRAAADWLVERLRAAGASAERLDWHGQPLVSGELRASGAAAGAPTVLCYGHFDVQPPDPLDEWESDPFTLVERDGWLYGRGVADDKGQLLMLVDAARSLAAEGRLPVHVRFVCEGEEEVGGHSIVDFLAEDTRGADACVIFDSAMVERDLPAFCLTTRGLIYLHLELRSGERDLHSGVYGGGALNALHALVETLAAVLPRDGRLPEPLMAGAAPLSEEEWRAVASIPPGARVLAEAGAVPADPAAAEEFYLRTCALPALDVNGIQGGSPRLQKTVLPVLAEANLSIRLAPGQELEEIAAAAERLLREALPAGAELRLERLSASPPGRVRPDAAAVQLALGAFERVLGKRPLLLRSGGTLPLVAALANRGIPTIVTGFDVPEGNIHSPNERLLTDYVELGVEAAKELFVALAELPRETT
jgi:acetylornithine deacetylase/succinyl-diaminopimelate desuccinylase-like protein